MPNNIWFWRTIETFRPSLEGTHWWLSVCPPAQWIGKPSEEPKSPLANFLISNQGQTPLKQCNGYRLRWVPQVSVPRGRSTRKNQWKFSDSSCSKIRLPKSYLIRNGNHGTQRDIYLALQGFNLLEHDLHLESKGQRERYRKSQKIAHEKVVSVGLNLEVSWPSWSWCGPSKSQSAFLICTIHEDSSAHDQSFLLQTCAFFMHKK